MFKKDFFVIATMLSLSACAAFTHKAEIETLSADSVLFSSPSLKTMVIQDPKNLRNFCLGRGADAVFSETESGDVSITLVSIGNTAPEKAGVQEQSGEQEMSGRTPAVLMARELFYRACELSNNAQLKDKDAIELFNNVLKVVSDGWLQEGKGTKITIGEKSTTTTKINNTNQSSGVTQPADAIDSPGNGSSGNVSTVNNLPFTPPQNCYDPLTGNPPTTKDRYTKLQQEQKCP